METEKAIEKLKNPKKIDLISIIRQFEREGIENFVITKSNIVETILKELEKKDKMINLMVKWINDRCLYVDEEDSHCEVIEDSCYEWQCGKDCRQCIKQYFEDKANEEENK